MSKSFYINILCSLWTFPALACFYHNPLLSVKDPYELLREPAIPEIRLPPYTIGEEDAAAARLARLRKRRDAVLAACDEALKTADPSARARSFDAGGRALSLPLNDTERGREAEASYQTLRKWARSFPFPAEGDPNRLSERIPPERIAHLERALEIAPQLARERILERRRSLYEVLCDNLVFLDARNINVSEFPNFPQWRDQIPEVLKTIRKTLEGGGRAAADACIRARVGQILDGGASAKAQSIVPRAGFPEDVERILLAIGPKEALPPLIDALATDHPEARKTLLQLAAKLSKRAEKPRPRWDRPAWIAWYEREWGAWPQGDGKALPDLSPVEFLPERLEEPERVVPLDPPGESSARPRR